MQGELVLNKIIKRIKKVIGYIIYNYFAKHLPVSNSKVNVFQKQIRAFCGKLMLEECGKKVNIEKSAVFSSKVSLGDYSGIGINAKIGGACRIGNYVMMAPNCTIYSRNHEFSDIDTPMMFQGYKDEQPVEIGDDVWIGGNVTILPGVKIGSHSIIGACSVVTKDVPEYAIVAGNPAVVKKYRK